MNHQDLITARALTFPLDASDTDAVVVQLKSYRSKDSYFTIAAFVDYRDAVEFVEMFPVIPNCKLRIVDCYMNILYEQDRNCSTAGDYYGTMCWWLDTSQELKDVVLGDDYLIAIKKPQLPKFSLRRIGNKLRSFVK
jgi:hypothetical protein